MLAPGDQAPDFAVESTNGPVDLRALLEGGPVVLYFFPRAMTSGCTAEALEFDHLLADFARMGVQVVGVSTDSVERLARFKEKYGLRLTFLSDQAKDIGVAYGTLKQEGARSHERDTVVIDKGGRVVLTYQRVKARGHAQTVLEDVRRLSEQGRI